MRDVLVKLTIKHLVEFPTSKLSKTEYRVVYMKFSSDDRRKTFWQVAVRISFTLSEPEGFMLLFHSVIIRSRKIDAGSRQEEEIKAVGHKKPLRFLSLSCIYPAFIHLWIPILTIPQDWLLQLTDDVTSSSTDMEP